MTDVNLTLVLTSSALIGCGVYLLLERSLSRVLVGLLMMGNGVSLAFLVAGGPAGDPPVVADGTEEPLSDPLPQAMVLTAIVIMLATTSFVLAMAYRSWQLTGHDDVQDDMEDAMIRQMAATDATSEAFSAASDDPDEVEESSDFAVGELGDEPEAAGDLGAAVAAEHEQEESPR